MGGDAGPHHVWPTVAGLAVALGGPPALVAASRHLLGAAPPLGEEVLLQLIFCGLAALIIFIVLRLERLPLDSIGLRRPGWPTLWVALLLTFAGFILWPLLMAPLAKRFGQAGADAAVAAMVAWPAWFRLFVAATSGFVEETLYRGYAVERLAAMTGRRWLGAVLSTAAFGAAHIPVWGMGFALTADLTAGAILVAFYLWRRDLLANCLAHGAGIAIGLFTTVPWAAAH